MSDFLGRILAVLGSALILLFFSEYYFLNESPVKILVQTELLQLPAILAEMVGWYSLFAYVFLITLARLSANTLAALFLAGSIFGWATEALVIPLAHEAPPFSWVFPSIGWHGVVDVMLGWYLLRIAMRRLSWPLLALAFIAVGLFWGAWATWFWQGAESDAELASLNMDEFARLAIVGGALWISGMILADRAGPRSFWPSRWEIGIVALLSAAMFIQSGLAYLPASAGLAALIGLTFAALRRGQTRRAPGHLDRLAQLQVPPAPGRYALAALMPAAAVSAYALILRFGLALPADLINGALMIGGGVFFLWAMWRTARGM